MEEAPENWGQISGLGAIRVDGQSATATGIQNGASIALTFAREDDRWWMQVFD